MSRLISSTFRLSIEARFFISHEKNHTVTQSTFDDPCRMLNKSGVTGFDSGL